MKSMIALAAVLFCVGPTTAAVEIRVEDEDFKIALNEARVEAEADFTGFKARLSADFGASEASVQAVFKAVEKPEDVYMAFKLAKAAEKPVEAVVTEYKTGKTKGWGVIAKNLGIKPGSKEFHELKKGGFSGRKAKPAKGKGRGKEKGKHKH